MGEYCPHERASPDLISQINKTYLIGTFRKKRSTCVKFQSEEALFGYVRIPPLHIQSNLIWPASGSHKALRRTGQFLATALPEE